MGILRKKNGFTIIEMLVVVAILAVLMIMSIFVFITQMAKGRDAKRKADLEKVRTVMENYLNDNDCYPSSLVCRASLLPYLAQVPCDPLNSVNYNYFYSFDATKTCRSWYKIYAKLENTNDPIIAKVGCANGCGPSNNYNYWIASPNMAEVGQSAGEVWPVIPVTGPTVTPPAGATSTPATPPTGGPTSTPVPTATAIPGPTNTPPPVATPTPTSPPAGNYYGCFSGVCRSIAGPWICPSINYQLPDCGGQCPVIDPATGEYKNECR